MGYRIGNEVWDISSIYEDIAACLYEYTMGDAARSHRIALTKSRYRKVLLDTK